MHRITTKILTKFSFNALISARGNSHVHFQSPELLPLPPCIVSLSLDTSRQIFGTKNQRTIIMAGDFVPESELNLKGMQRYFNSYTLRGRFNYVAATYGAIFGSVFLYKLLKKKPKALPGK